MCQLMKPLLIKADRKQIWAIQTTAGKHKYNLELSSCEIGPFRHSWGWKSKLRGGWARQEGPWRKRLQPRVIVWLIRSM